MLHHTTMTEQVHRRPATGSACVRRWGHVSGTWQDCGVQKAQHRVKRSR